MFGQATAGKNVLRAFLLLLGALGFKLFIEFLTIVPFFDSATLTITEIPSYLLFWVTVASIIPILLFIQQWNQRHEESISLVQFFYWNKLSNPLMAGLLLFGLGVIFLNFGLELNWPESSYLDKNSLDSFKYLVIANGWIDGIFKMMAIVFAAAIVEELLFRTFFISALRNWVGAGGAIFVSALLFTIIHTQYFSINPLLLFNVFILSVMLGFVRILSHSVIPSVILHAFNNGIGFCVVNLEQIHPTAFGINELSVKFWLFAGIILIIVSWMFLGNDLMREGNLKK